MRPPPLVRGLLPLALVSLLAALWAGLGRIGWRLPGPDLAASHGPWMASVFFGTLVSLERAVVLPGRWAFAAPVLSGTAGLALLAGPATGLGPWLSFGGSLVFVAAAAAMVVRLPAAFTWVMGMGALSWVGGNLIWLADGPLALAAACWAGFLVLTIAGERLELGRLSPAGAPSQLLFGAAVGLIAVGLVWSPASSTAGLRLYGLGLLLLAAWLLAYDHARRSLGRRGVTRYISASLLAGYVWLAVGGLLTLLFPGARAGWLYDAMLHAVFLGFVFSMVFGHAPLILAGLLGIPAVPYHPRFYLHLGLLHATLALRIIGDVAQQAEMRRWGGLGNAAAVLFFLASMALALIAVRRASRRR